MPLISKSPTARWPNLIHDFPVLDVPGLCERVVPRGDVLKAIRDESRIGAMEKRQLAQVLRLVVNHCGEGLHALGFRNRRHVAVEGGVELGVAVPALVSRSRPAVLR